MSTLTLIGNHLWQSTVFAMVLGLATLALRKNRAAVRHALWLAASIKFLVPFAALVALGAQLGLRPPAPLKSREVTVVVGALGALGGMTRSFFLMTSLPDGGSSSIAPSGTPGARENGLAVASIIALVWAGGSFLVLASWCFRWRRVARIARAAAPIDAGFEYETLRRLERTSGLTRPIGLVASTASLEPGVFGVLRPVLVWPQTIGAHLNDKEIAGILAHEVSHVRRRDNLTAALHALVEALFWFHPLVWWIGAKLVDERERACDEDVLRSGSEPAAYAETILKTCRAYLEMPHACGAGVTGSSLTKRIERIMIAGAAEPLSTGVRLLLAAVAVATIGAPIVVGAVIGPEPYRQNETFPIKRVQQRLYRWDTWAARQAVSPSNAPLPQFEVASIKQNKSGDGRVFFQVQPGGRFSATNVTLKMLIRNAYQLQDFQMIGGPSWLSDDHFDVVAKAERGEEIGDPFRAERSGEPSRGQLMLRALLAERFKLAAHDETREMPIYALVQARSDGKLGPELHRSQTDCDAMVAGARGRGAPPPPGPPQPGDPVPCGLRIGMGTMTVGGAAMPQLANSLGMFVGRIVEDHTGLDGRFDFNLTWTPDQMIQRPPGAPEAPPIDPNGPSIFTALQEQLGLKLDSRKGPVRVLVIDRVEHPTEN